MHLEAEKRPKFQRHVSLKTSSVEVVQIVFAHYFCLWLCNRLIGEVIEQVISSNRYKHELKSEKKKTQKCVFFCSFIRFSHPVFLTEYS